MITVNFTLNKHGLKELIFQRAQKNAQNAGKSHSRNLRNRTLQCKMRRQL